MSMDKRISKLRYFMELKGLSVVVLTSPDNQYYYSGFKAILYSRPIYYVVTPEETAYIVPGLEENHAYAEAKVDKIIVYYEHPEKADHGIHPLHSLLNYLGTLKQSGKMGVEFSNIPLYLSEELTEKGWNLEDLSQFIVDERAVKDAEELQTMREAGRLVSLALRHSLDSIKEGVTELDIDNAGTHALFKEVSEVHPNASLDLFVMSPSGPERSVMPHVFSNTRKIKKGDVIIHSRQVSLNGYRAECERTVVLGQPNDEVRQAFEVAVEAQYAAFEKIRAGVPMKEIDWAAREVIQKAGYGEYSVHRTGHSIGLAPHEAPFIRFDNEEPLKEGMAFSIEPGIYIPNLGGFRHSDTIIVTKNGYELITDYPSQVNSLLLNTIRGGA